MCRPLRTASRGELDRGRGGRRLVRSAVLWLIRVRQWPRFGSIVRRAGFFAGETEGERQRSVRANVQAADGHPLSPTRAMLDQCRQQREAARQVDENLLEVPLDGSQRTPPHSLGGLGVLSPDGELARDDLLQRLAIGEINRAALASATAVDLVQRQARRERRRLDD